MKKLFAIIAFSVVQVAQAAPEIKFQDVKKPVKCAKTKELFTGLQSEFAETVVWTSSNAMLDDRTSVALFKNPKSGSWTLVEFDYEIACVLASGEDRPV